MLIEIIIFTIVGLLSWAYVTRLPPDYPPTPPIRLPLIGHLPYFLWYNLPQDKAIRRLFSTYQKDGILAFHVGTFKTVLLGDYGQIKTAFKMNETNYRYPSEELLEIARMTRGSAEGTEGILDNNGTKWQEQRRFMLSTLRDFGFGKSSMEEMIADEITYFKVYMLSLSEQGPIAVHNFFNVAVFNVLWRIVAGERFEYEDPELQDIMQSISDFLTCARLKPSLAMVFPKLRDFFPAIDVVHDNMKRAKKVRDFLDRAIAKHKANFDMYTIKDYIDAFLDTVQQMKNPASSFHGQESNEHLRQSLFDMFFAGAETTSSTLTWSILFMVRNPEIQKRVQEEIHLVVGDDRLPELVDKLRMPYTEAVILESQRIGNILPRGINHATWKAPARVGNYVIPPGHSVQTLMSNVFHNENNWPEPMEFIPERFLNPDKTKVIRDERLIPFGMGRRQCPGETLAKAQLFLFFTALFEKFEFTPEDPSVLPSMDCFSGITRVPVPFNVNVRTLVT